MGNVAPTKPKSAAQETAEGFIEKIIFGGRWILAPLYVGLLLSLLPLLYRFFQEFVDLVKISVDADMHHITLKILELSIQFFLAISLSSLFLQAMRISYQKSMLLKNLKTVHTGWVELITPD